MSSPPDSPVHTVLLFGQRPDVRAEVRTAIGRRLPGGAGRITWIECEDIDALLRHVDAGGIDLCILDGEAQPTGGMGISRQLKYEITDCPAVCVLIARADDRWLASWSLADATLVHPLDALTAAGTIADLLREHAAGVPVRR